jgi:hypothetical protein
MCNNIGKHDPYTEPTTTNKITNYSKTSSKALNI